MKKVINKKTKVVTKNTSSEPKSLAAFIQTLQSVKIDSEEAKLNETTMSDNNGKRITYTIIKGKKYPNNDILMIL